MRWSWIFSNCWLAFSELPALETQTDVTGDSFSDLCPSNFTNSDVNLSFFLLKLFTHQSCILSNMLYSLQSHYSREKMKVLLQFRFVGDTAGKKKKKWSLLRGRRTFGWGGGRCCCYCFCLTKIYCFLCTKKVGSISGVNVLAKVQGLTEFLTQRST